MHKHQTIELLVIVGEAVAGACHPGRRLACPRPHGHYADDVGPMAGTPPMHSASRDREHDTSASHDLLMSCHEDAGRRGVAATAYYRDEQAQRGGWHAVARASGAASVWAYFVRRSRPARMTTDRR